MDVVYLWGRSQKPAAAVDINRRVLTLDSLRMLARGERGRARLPAFGSASFSNGSSVRVKGYGNKNYS